MWSRLRVEADPTHVAAVTAAVDAADPRCGTTKVVAIDGPSGSGKTTLAAAVAAALDAPVVHLDRIYPGWDGLAAAVPILVDEVLEPIASGRRATHRVWSWPRGTWRGSRSVDPSPVVVVEGCGSSTDPARLYAAVRVWVEADRDERRRRGLERDGDTYRPHWDRWAAQEEALFTADRTREHADLVLRTDRP